MRAAPDTPRPVLALIGLRCTGKTTLGRLLATHFEVPFVDLDEALCTLARDEGRREVHSGALLAALGEPAFRELESRTLVQQLRDETPCVLASGGGVVERESNRALLQQRALCVQLCAPLAVLRARLDREPQLRPALTVAGAGAELEQLAVRRAAHYAQLAALVVDTGDATPREALGKLLERVTCVSRGSFELRAQQPS